MRIAVVVNCLKIGGMERVAVNLADAFHDAGHDTNLIYLKNRKCEIKPKNLALPVHLFNLKKSVLLNWVIYRRMANVQYHQNRLYFQTANGRKLLLRPLTLLYRSQISLYGIFYSFKLGGMAIPILFITSLVMSPAGSFTIRIFELLSIT